MNQPPERSFSRALIFAALVAVNWPSFAVADGGTAPTTPAGSAQSFTDDGSLRFPTDYRDWPFLTSGLDMNYQAAAMPMGHHMFDNVFVDPSSLKVFRSTGKWPEGTVFVKESRKGRTDGSINKFGQFQDEEVIGVELHIKNSKRYENSWAFFDFDESAPAKPISKEEDGCSDCHHQHGAVDNTFVQFYPTLIGIARSKDTLSAGYRKESDANAK